MLPLYTLVCGPLGGHILKENHLPHFQQILTAIGSSVRGEVCAHLPSWCCDFCLACPCCHTYCGFICAASLLCWKTPFLCRHLLPLALTIFLFPTSLRIMSFVIKGCDTDFSFRTEHSAASCWIFISLQWLLCPVNLY